MHFEILVEDQSGKKALDILVPKIIGDRHTFKIRAYKGIGRIPKPDETFQRCRKTGASEQSAQVAQGLWENLFQLSVGLSGGGDSGLRSGRSMP